MIKVIDLIRKWRECVRKMGNDIRIMGLFSRPNFVIIYFNGMIVQEKCQSRTEDRS